MAASTNPIFGRQGDVQLGGSILGPTAVTATDGTGLLVSIFQADTVEGGFVDSITLKAAGSPGATVARIFMCNVTTAFTSNTSNTAVTATLIAEATLAAVTGNNTAATNDITIPIRRPLPPGYRLLIGFGTSTGAAGTGYAVTTWAMKY